MTPSEAEPLADIALAACDRCGGSDEVETATFCSTCGPVPLCWRCWTLHFNEIKDGEV